MSSYETNARIDRRKAWNFSPQVQCPICGDTNRQLLGLRSDQPLTVNIKSTCNLLKVSVYRCHSCYFVYCDPIPIITGNYKDVYGATDEYFSIILDEERRAYYQQIVANLQHFASRKGNFLDVGTGRGEQMYFADKAGYQVYGTEPNPSFAAYAQQQYGFKHIHIGQLHEACFSDEMFDAVTLNAVLEHIPFPLSILREIFRVMRKGGVLHIEVPSGQTLRTAIPDFALHLMRKPWTVHLSPLTPPFHLFEFSEKSISTALESCGFNICYLKVEAGKNRFPRRKGIKHQLLRSAYGMIVWLENQIGRGFNIRVYAIKP